MKNLSIALVAIMFVSCSRSSRNVSEPFPTYMTKEVDWISYEGTLPAENGQPVHVELHLAPATPGMDSYYKITEDFNRSDNSNTFSGFVNSVGKYSVLFGSPGHNIIQIINKRKLRSLMRGKQFSPPDFVKEDLFLKSYGDHELVLVNENFKELPCIDSACLASAMPFYKLTRRSELFTVEGYFTVYNDTSEYFERNTRKQWAVARLACYDEAVEKYALLATENFEGIYLKALSYTVRHIDKGGNEIDALVFKKILQMDSTGGIRYP